MDNTYSIACFDANCLNGAQIQYNTSVRLQSVPYLVISLDAPHAADLAEELSQRLLGRQVIQQFMLTSFEHRAILDIADVAMEVVERTEAEVSN